MGGTLIDDVVFEADIAQLVRKLHVRPGSAHIAEFERLVAEAEEVAHPKAFYRVAFVGERSDDTVEIAGVTLTSRVLRVNLDQVFRVFPYVATCGTELEDWSNSPGDLLRSYWSEGIREVALAVATRKMREHMVEAHGLGRTATMAPGSIGDWPLRQQRPLFEILGDTEATLGVRLTDSCLMLPTKSVSGIVFPTEKRFESCQLCPRDVCPGRRAPYDRDLYDRRYRASD
jgi:hypothetical protein